MTAIRAVLPSFLAAKAGPLHALVSNIANTDSKKDLRCSGSCLHRSWVRQSWLSMGISWNQEARTTVCNAKGKGRRAREWVSTQDIPGDDDVDDDDGIEIVEDLFNIDKGGWLVKDLEEKYSSFKKKGGKGRKEAASFADMEDDDDDFDGDLDFLDDDLEDDDDEDDFDDDLRAKLRKRKFDTDEEEASAREAVTRAVLPARELRRLEAQMAKDDAKPVPTVRRTQRVLKIISGSVGGRRILTPRDNSVRPMMEVVRAAVFSMLQSRSGGGGQLPGGRFLDLYSGSGSVGIEAISRGCEVAHFVELDKWVVSRCLDANLQELGLASSSRVHTRPVEELLEQLEEYPDLLGGPFDFISVTPPYEAVDYSVLLDQLARSPAIHPATIVIVEYPKKFRVDLPDTLGPLTKVRDRKYGRTFIALYGPVDEDDL